MVLVVDKPALADALTETLNRSGYAAIASYDGEGALETALLMPPQLLIAEVGLPGMNGVELAIAVRENFPDCRILLLSGLAATAGLLASASRKGHKFELLDKPIDKRSLLAHVSASLQSQGADPGVCDAE